MQNKDYLPNTGMTIVQREDMFRMNTDTKLLGQFMKIKRSDTVLDLGCNNGALMLYASVHHPRFIYGVDLFEEALKLAKQNLELNQIENFELIHGDATEVVLPKVDVIVSNPPYFKTVDERRKNDNPYRAAARHEGSLTIERLLKVCEKTLSDHGHLFMVHRPLRITEIFEEALKGSLRPRTMCLVYDENKDEAVSVLLEFHKNYKGDLHVLKPITITR
ncbi:MAG: methyltransferase [Erysipelotrichaceae bacterium]|nr:methyltransferase [Erysipelotrichaceae bacterium]